MFAYCSNEDTRQWTGPILSFCQVCILNSCFFNSLLLVRKAGVMYCILFYTEFQYNEKPKKKFVIFYLCKCCYLLLLFLAANFKFCLTDILFIRLVRKKQTCL